MDWQVQEQIEAARRALAADPLNPKLNGRLGMLYDIYRVLEPAKVCYQRACSLNPQALRWHYYLGRVLAARGEEAESILAFQRAAELKPGFLPTYVRLGEVYTLQGELDLAEQMLGKVVATDETNAVVYACLGRVAAKRKDYAAAVEHYEKALSIAEGAQVHYALAMACRMLGRSEQAAEHLKRSQELKTELPDRDPLQAALARLEIGGYHEYSLGLDRLREGDLEAATRHFETVLRVKPELTADAHYCLGNIKLKQGLDALAIHHYRQALSIRPKDHQALHNLGTTLMNTGLHADAVDCFRQVLDLRPHEALANINMGKALLRLGRREQAIKQYRQAIHKDPTQTQVHGDLARALSAQGDYEASIRHWREYLRAAPEEVPALVSLASDLARNGRTAEAEQVFDQAARLAPDDATIAARRAEVLEPPAPR